MSLSSSAEKALKAFEDGSRNNVDCQVLLDNTFETFKLLERWETADLESNVSSVRSIIRLVREQGHDYFRTLDDSISVAITLNGLAQDVSHLAESLLDPACKPKDIKDFIAEMRGYTQDALEKSNRISTAYREVRKGINEISNSIPGEMAKLERREERTVAKKDTLDRRIERTKVMKTVGTTALAVVSGVAIVSLPPLVLILPIALPIAILALEVYENRSSKTLKKRETQILTCQEGLQELQNITKCLAHLAQHVDTLIDFWLRSDTMLETISGGVDRIRGNTARLRLKAIVKQWNSAGEFYAAYATKLKRIQSIDCGATSSLRSGLSSSSSSGTSRGSNNHSHRSRDEKRITSTSTDPKLEVERRNSTKESNHRSSSSRNSPR
ncbi:hypothetical protein MVEN_02471800 [Mycena venus]|uniref:Uncharacterized protein n=1 Tax=Mycena venus TaxID=2733690 RepID=A0A8H6WXB9_9AGAR|nr:hypothetical protein MVEN_02471800 [Mycena venus]